MKKNIICLLLFTTVIITACQHNNIEINLTENAQKIFGEPLIVDCLMGFPFEMALNDTLLYLNDVHSQMAITVIDIKNNRYVDRVISLGKGPEEVIPPSRMFPQDGCLYLYHGNSGTMKVYDCKNRKMVNHIIFNDRPRRVQKTNDGYIGIGMFETGRFHIYDLKGELIHSMGTYPFDGDKMEYITRFLLYQGRICYSPTANYFAYGYSYSDRLEFFELTNGQAVLTKQYGTTDVKAHYGDQRLKLDDDCLIGYKAADTSEKYCYMLYSGKTYLENDRDMDGANYIMMFDWKGNHIKTFESDLTLYSFCVDEQNHVIYGIGQGEESRSIFKFDISL